MAIFQLAVEKTLVNEGGFQNDYDDHANWTSGKVGQGTLVGTKFGITALDMPGCDISNLSETEAASYYSEHYWKALYSQITSQEIANKLFDMGVLFGVGEAIMLLQMTLKATVDGQFGPNTLAALNQSDPVELLKAYKTNLVTHAFNVASRNPEERAFLKGWSDRINQ